MKEHAITSIRSLLEADDRIRKLERQAAQSGTMEDQEAYWRARERGGKANGRSWVARNLKMRDKNTYYRYHAYGWDPESQPRDILKKFGLSPRDAMPGREGYSTLHAGACVAVSIDELALIKWTGYWPWQGPTRSDIAPGQRLDLSGADGEEPGKLYKPNIDAYKPYVSVDLFYSRDHMRALMQRFFPEALRRFKV